MRRIPLARIALVAAAISIAAGMTGGCSVIEKLRPGARAEKADAPATTASAGDTPDLRRFIGPNYCPELRIYSGAEVLRTYERGHQGDQDHVIWQASVGKTARECLYDPQGGLTIKVGVSGRAVSGPKGGADSVTVPIKIAVVKNKEAVLATEKFTLSVAIPPQGSATFTQVKEISVPSPGAGRDYIIYVGFDVGDWDPMKEGSLAVAAVEPTVVVPPAAALTAVDPAPPAAAKPPVRAAEAPAPAKKNTNELPTPTEGFVLGQ